MRSRIEDLLMRAYAEWINPMPCPLCNGSGFGVRYMWCSMCIGSGLVTRRLWRVIVSHLEKGDNLG